MLGLMAASTIALTAAFLALFGPGDGTHVLKFLSFSDADLLYGAVAGLRLSAVFTVGALAVHFTKASEVLPYLSGHSFPAYAAGSMIRLATTLRSDAHTLREAQAVRGHKFRSGLGAVRSWLPLIVPLFVRTMRRSREQAYALHTAGLTPSSRGHLAFAWSTIAALAALAVAGRLALVAVPNVSLSYFVLFIAGVAYGPRVGFMVGILSRTAADLVLSGPTLLAVPWVLGEGIIGFGCGISGMAINFGQRGPHAMRYAAALAATAGWMMTAAYSVTLDTTIWLFIRYLGAGFGGLDYALPWTTVIVAGLLFNVGAMVFNAILFGVAAYPVLSALRSAGLVSGIQRSSARVSGTGTVA